MAEVKAGVVAFGDVFGGAGGTDTGMRPDKPAFWAALIWLVAVALLLILVTRR